jgi:hypothetical protein
MKHIENINEWFGNKKQDGDDFAEKLVDIIEKENIKISYVLGGDLKANVDGIEYRFSEEESGKMFSLASEYHIRIYKNDKYDSEIKISSNYNTRIEKIYKQQQKEEKEKSLNNLPDLSR